MAKAAQSKTETTANAHPDSFEAALSELETLVRTMEGGQLALADSLTAYQRGTVLLRFCQETLTAAEQQIQVLENGTLQDFKPTTEE